jgi:hypothetical protein
MTWFAGITPADKISSLEFPANVSNREAKRTGEQIPPVKSHCFFCGLIANRGLVRVSPFCRSANVDSVGRLAPPTCSSPLDSGGHNFFVHSNSRSHLGFIGFNFEKELISQAPLGRTGQPDDIADIAVFLASDDSRWLTGERLMATGGIR